MPDPLAARPESPSPRFESFTDECGRWGVRDACSGEPYAILCDQGPFALSDAEHLAEIMIDNDAGCGLAFSEDSET